MNESLGVLTSLNGAEKGKINSNLSERLIDLYNTGFCCSVLYA